MSSPVPSRDDADSRFAASTEGRHSPRTLKPPSRSQTPTSRPASVVSPGCSWIGGSSASGARSDTARALSAVSLPSLPQPVSSDTGAFRAFLRVPRDPSVRCRVREAQVLTSLARRPAIFIGAFAAMVSNLLTTLKGLFAFDDAMDIYACREPLLARLRLSASAAVHFRFADWDSRSRSRRRRRYRRPCLHRRLCAEDDRSDGRLHGHPWRMARRELCAGRLAARLHLRCLGMVSPLYARSGPLTEPALTKAPRRTGLLSCRTSSCSSLT